MITSAAVKYQMTNQKLVIFPLHRHSDFKKMIAENALFPVDMYTVVYGFINTDAKGHETFVTPFEAKNIARAEGQEFVPGKENPYCADLKDYDLW